jgi:hypothetical protein
MKEEMQLKNEYLSLIEEASHSGSEMGSQSDSSVLVFKENIQEKKT